MTDVQNQRRLIHVQASQDVTSDDLLSLTNVVLSALQSGEDLPVIATSNAVTIFSLPLGDQAVPPVQVVGAINPAMIAKVARDVNVAYTRALGDNTVIPWDEDTEENKMALVHVVLDRLRHARDPRTQHEAWVQSKVADGWQYGQEKNVEAKTHPALVDYDSLPAEQKMKDYLFAGVVESMRVKLPQPSSLTQPVQRAGARDNEDGTKSLVFTDCSFLDLTTGNLFRFTQDPQQQTHAAMSELYIQYTDNNANWSIDTVPYNVADLEAQLNTTVAEFDAPLHEVVTDQDIVQADSPAPDFSSDDA